MDINQTCISKVPISQIYTLCLCKFHMFLSYIVALLVKETFLKKKLHLKKYSSIKFIKPKLFTFV